MPSKTTNTIVQSRPTILAEVRELGAQVRRTEGPTANLRIAIEDMLEDANHGKRGEAA
jgi:hypothetical protein